MAWRLRESDDGVVCYQRSAGSLVLAAWADQWSVAERTGREWRPVASGEACSFRDAMEAADTWAWVQGFRPDRTEDR